jgi:hypothetical protein
LVAVPRGSRGVQPALRRELDVRKPRTRLRPGWVPDLLPLRRQGSSRHRQYVCAHASGTPHAHGVWIGDPKREISRLGTLPASLENMPPNLGWQRQAPACRWLPIRHRQSLRPCRCHPEILIPVGGPKARDGLRGNDRVVTRFLSGLGARPRLRSHGSFETLPAHTCVSTTPKADVPGFPSYLCGSDIPWHRLPQRAMSRLAVGLPAGQRFDGGGSALLQ